MRQTFPGLHVRKGVYTMKLISFDELKPKKGITFTRDHIRRLGKQRRFPQSVKIGGGHRLIFVEQEIDAHIAAAMAARNSE